MDQIKDENESSKTISVKTIKMIVCNYFIRIYIMKIKTAKKMAPLEMSDKNQLEIEGMRGR